MTTQPKPAPSGGGTFGGITLTVPPVGGSSSGADKYGLGVWGSQQINPGDLPVLANIIASGKTTTGDDIVKAFAGADPVTLAEMQRALYLGGFYGQSSKYTPSYGVIAPEDITAFAKAVKTAGQSGQGVSALLLNQAKIGTAAGIAAAHTQLLTAKAKAEKPSVIDVPASADLEAAAEQAFEQVLGRKARPHEAAAFAAAYQATVVGLQRNADSQAASLAQTATGGLTSKQATGFDTTLQGIGQPPLETPQVAHGLNNGGGPIVPVENFGEQLNDLQSLGTAVTEAAAAKTPAISAAPSSITVQEPPAVDVAAANFARAEHPKQAAGADLASTFDKFLSILGSNFGGG